MGRRIDTSPPKVCAYGLAIAITALAPSAARADDADRAPVIAIDLVSDAAVAAGVFNVAHTAPAGMVGYALGAPIVHAAYGKWAHAEALAGVAAGMVVAQIIDAAYLSRASDEPTPRMLSIGGAF